MQKVLHQQSIKVMEPSVILPLRVWRRIEEELEEREDLERFNKAFKASRGKKMISLEVWGKKHGLK